jgi:hypothetical protein
LNDGRTAAHQRRQAQHQPHNDHIRFHRRPANPIAKDFVTIKRDGFTKVTKRQLGRYSQNREGGLGGPPSRFRHKPY